MSQLLDTLEEQFGKITLWEWTRDWMQNEAECEDDERCSLEEYLCLRAEKIKKRLILYESDARIDVQL